MEEKLGSKLGVFKIAQIKRMALGMKPIEVKINKLTSKIEDLSEQKDILCSQIFEIHNCIKAYIGGNEDQMNEASAIIKEVLKGKKDKPDEDIVSEEELKMAVEEYVECNLEFPVEETETPRAEPEAEAEFEPGIQEETDKWSTSK